MTELATEHVRMLDAGRLRVAHESPLTTSCFAPVASRKTQLLQHGNAFGLSFVATEKGFVMTNNDELEASCADYTKRRQEAMDHGQKLTLEEIHAVPATKEVQLPSISYWIALSPDELTVAVAYGESVSLFEVAHIVEATAPAPFHTFSKLQAQEIAWCTDTTSERLAVLTVEKQVFVCTLAGGKEVIETQIDASSVSWSPSGEQIAVGLVDGTIGVYGRDTLQILRSIGQPECCSDEGLEVHHVNWAEDNLILVGYQKYDEGMEETTALACIYENDEFVELDEVVGFFDVENRRHQYFSVFLSDWRMFFIGCSLSADIELLVSDPDGGDWALWKPLEKYQARLPMNANDEESFPTGLALNLNSTSPVPVDEDAFPPVPIVSCTNTEGLLVNFGFVDTTVHDVLEFVKSPVSFGKKVTRIAAVKEEPKEASDSPPGSPTGNPAEAKTKMAAAAKQAISHEYGQNDENEFAESDGESSDEEEERKEEEEKARNAFRSVASDGSDFIVSELFPNLFKTLGATYDEEEHASTLERLEKDGKVYEADFIPWYVNWIFGDDESDSDEDDVPSASVVEPTEMKSKEEIAAAFSKFTAKEGSWKCAVCMVNNNPDAVKCSACETPNPAAPKVGAVTPASATSAGSIGSGGFSFPAATGDASKLSSFSFGATPGTSSKSGGTSKPAGFSFGDKAATTGFSFPSSKPGPGFSFPTSTKPATELSFGDAASSTASESTGVSGYPPDTTAKPKPPAFGAANGSCYPPDTTAKPKPPAFGASGSGYPPDTTSKPKPPAFGAASGSGYPPDTTAKPKPPAFGASGSGYPPDTTSKPKPPAFGAASGSGYPPDTTAKPKPPAFGASGSGYPPDTTAKPKPPAFGASGSGYPPDTTSKPKPPAFGAASGSGYPPDTTAKPKPPAFGASGSGYPPDTTSKPKPPAFGAASGSGYPPDTTSKPKPPAFGAASSSGYPPDTTSKPKPPAFGAVSRSGYPPDTTAKPKPPAFGDTTSSIRSSSSGYPPDTSTKPKPPMFGQSTASDKTTSSFGFGSFGKNLFGSTPGSSDTSAPIGNSSSTATPTKANSLFGSAFGASTAVEKAPDTSSSPFGVLPKAKSKRTFSFGAESEEVSSKTNTTRPSFSFDSVSSTLDTTRKSDKCEDRPQTKRTLKFGDTSALATKTISIPSTMIQTKPVAAPVKAGKGTPSSRMEGQLWKLIIDFDKSLQRVNESSKNISSKDSEFSKTLLKKMDKLRTQISSLCDEINNLDESRDQIEKDVLFVIGNDGDVHEQLEYGREILNSFNDEALKRTLEEQPLDQRSKETRESLKGKLNEVETCCLELDSHLTSSKIGADCAVSSAHLFRVLKQTYDNSKMQYNKACKLAEHLEKLSLRGNRMRQTNGVSGMSSVETEVHPVVSKAEMMQMIVEAEQRSQNVRRNFLSLCNNVVTPRDVFSTPRRKLAPPTLSDSSASPLRTKACSKLMPKTQLSVASPMSSAKQSSRSVSFKETPVKSGSKLFSLAEAMTPKEEPAKLVQTPQPAKASVGVGKAPQRPSLGAPATEAKPSSTVSSTAPKSNVFSFPKSSKDSANSFSAPATKEETTSTSAQFSGFGINSPTVKPKPKADTKATPAFSLGGQNAPGSSSAFSFGSKDSKITAQQPSIASASTDYKTLLEKFYKVHNPSKSGTVIEKALTTYKGREEDLFTRLFTMYVPDSTPEDVKKYLNGGPVPPKSESAAASSKRPAPANAASKSPFGGLGAQATTPKGTATNPSPFGASPSAFSLGPSANKSSGFGAFGSAATSSSTTPLGTATASPFGKPAVDYRQRLVEFYQKYNPDKLSSVDATLQKYKGNEEKLFQNLAVKYKVNGANGVQPASPAMPAASPFGKPGSFSSPGSTSAVAFGSASSVGFGAAKPAPAASPFGSATQTSSGFGPAGGSGFGGGFQSAAATTPSFGAPTPFGAAAGGFGAATSGANYREKLAAFYQQHNPGKLSSVDATLERYKGREDHLFAMLEQKYVKKTPTASATGGFGGIPSTTTFGGGSGFGAPSTLGAAPPAFGSASTFGGPAQPAFGASAGSGFGMASQMGGGFGAAAPATPSGPATGSGFSTFGSQTPTFGGAPQQSGGFGAAANSGGFGAAANGGGFGAAANNGGFSSGFGGGAASGGFGQSVAFSNPSFTQMR
ncbi:hypothetical protein PRNP1_003783 [Phytophthora ramorum]